MSTETKRGDIKSLHQELRRVESMGHIVKISARSSPIHDTGHHHPGLEFFMDTKVSAPQIRKIVHYIVEKYNFDAYYYTKTHSVKVWYRDAK